MWEVGDLIEFEDKVYMIGDINGDRNRIVYRLDRKFEPSVELIVRKRQYG